MLPHSYLVSQGYFVALVNVRRRTTILCGTLFYFGLTGHISSFNSLAPGRYAASNFKNVIFEPRRTGLKGTAHLKQHSY